MGRRRKAENEWLPPQCYVGRSAYEWKPGDGRTIRLCPLGASRNAVFRAYEEAKRKDEVQQGSVAELIGEYLHSEQFKKLAKSSQYQYLRHSEKLIDVFGKMSANSVKPAHIRKFMDRRGAHSESQANMDHALLGVVYAWGYERGKVTANPCKGVKRFPVIPRTRYITDEEYAALYSVAEPIVQAVMEISYCCAARISDVLDLKREQLRESGIYIRQGKTGKEQIKRWTPRLREAVALAVSTQKTPSMTRVVAGKKGQQLKQSTFSYHWQKAKKEAVKQFPDLDFDFTFHDLKAKAISDYEGDKQRFSGHKSFKMVQVYDRKTEIVDSHE